MSQLLNLPNHLFRPEVVVLAALGTVALQLHGKDAGSDLKLSSFVLSFVLFWMGSLFIRGLYFIFIYPHYFSPLRHLPTPRGWHCIWGHVPQMQESHPGEKVKMWNNTVNHSGVMRFFTHYCGERLLALSWEVVRDIMVTNSYDWEKPALIRDALSTVTGAGLVTSEGEEHRTQRKHMLPAFRIANIKGLYPVFWRKSRELVQAINKEVGGLKGELCVSKWASRATLDIIGMAAMGRDFSAIRNPEDKLVKQYDEVFKGQSILREFFILGRVMPQWMIQKLPRQRYRKFGNAMLAIRSRCQELIDEKRAKLRAQEEPDVDILSVAIMSGKFTDEGLQNQLMTFFAAGHETTSVSLTWAIYALCLNPEMQAQLRKEVRAHFPSLDKDVAVTSKDFDNPPYLHAVVHETLRCYPAVPVTVRVAKRDMEVMGVFIPSGTSITIPQWAINADKSLWKDDPDKFKPERWLDKDGKFNNNGGSKNHYAMSTFMHGPRSCIGADFAKAELVCLLGALIHRFEFELADKTLKDPNNLKVDFGITVKPKDGLRVIARAVP